MTAGLVDVVDLETQPHNPYHALIDANPQPMWVIDRKSQRFLAVNRAAAGKYAGTTFVVRLPMVRPPQEVLA